MTDADAEDLFEHAPCGYISIRPDDRIVRVNATFLEWTGYDRDTLLAGATFLDLLSAGGRIFFETHVRPLLRMQGFVREIAFDILRHDRERLPVLVNATQRERPGGGSITRITVFDATDRRRYERELLQAQKKAEEEARIRSELIAMVSHDVRAPLNAIITAAALLEKTGPSPQQAKYVRVLQSSASHALTLLNSTLDLSRLEAGRQMLREREFGMRQLVYEVVASARLAARSKPDLEVKAVVDDAVPPRLVGDPGKLGQVLTNLMTNAVKFTERGLVSVVISVRTLTPEAVELEVLVSDTGIGIPADRLPHIFDEFTQASDEIADRYGGAGLGLAISRRLLELHGATLSVTSTVGQGTTFSFVLALKLAGVGA